MHLRSSADRSYFLLLFYPYKMTRYSVYRDGYVTLQEYMAFMISKETENIHSSEEIESAFRALSKEYRPYVTAEELYAVRSVFL